MLQQQRILSTSQKADTGAAGHSNASRHHSSRSFNITACRSASGDAELCCVPLLLQAPRSCVTDSPSVLPLVLPRPHAPTLPGMLLVPPGSCCCCCCPGACCSASCSWLHSSAAAARAVLSNSLTLRSNRPAPASIAPAANPATPLTQCQHTHQCPQAMQRASKPLRAALQL